MSCPAVYFFLGYIGEAEVLNTSEKREVYDGYTGLEDYGQPGKGIPG